MAALAVFKNYEEVIINDLCDFSIPVLEEHAIGPGNVHYTGEGLRLQGIEVAKTIANEIDLKIHDCPSAAPTSVP